MAGNEEEDRRQMQKAAGGPIDCVLDLLPPMASPSWVRAAVLAVRPYGRAILMGGTQGAGRTSKKSKSRSRLAGVGAERSA